MPRRNLIAPAMVAIALLLSACATSTPPQAPVAGSTSEPISNAASEDESNTPSDEVIASPPSIKPDIEIVKDPSESPETTALVNIDNFPATLSICPRMTVSNAPDADRNRKITNYAPIADVEGVLLAVAPVEGGCFSSGFGLREGRRHKGIDIHNADPVDVFAAAGGRIRERVYRDDYGNMLLIEHGDGVFARYAHLERFAPGIEIGAFVESGQTIGVMGNTASYSIPRHLHYEVLLGTYGTLTGSFGLIPVDIFDYLP